jgi:lysozyme family protein
MKANFKTLGLGCLAAVAGFVVTAQVMPTNEVTQPAPMVHKDQQSRNSPTNEIVDPSGALQTNRMPELTNTPTPLKPGPIPPPENK